MNDSFALVWYRFDIEILGLHVWVLKVTSDDMTVCWFDIACWDSAGCVWVIFCALNYCMFSETSHCFDRFYRCETINIWKRTIVDPSWDGVKPQGHVTYTTGKADPRTRRKYLFIVVRTCSIMHHSQSPDQSIMQPSNVYCDCKDQVVVFNYVGECCQLIANKYCRVDLYHDNFFPKYLE